MVEREEGRKGKKRKKDTEPNPKGSSNEVDEDTVAEGLGLQ